MRAFLHFVCCFFVFVYFRRSKGGACFLLSDFEAENCPCVDFVLCTLLRGELNCFNFCLSCSHRCANTEPRRPRLKSHAKQKVSTCTHCPIETLSVRSSNCESGQRTASCFSHATAGDFSEDPRDQNLNVSSACMFGLSSQLVSRFCLFLSRHSQILLLLRMKTCAQSKLRSIRTRLSRLQTVIDDQEGRRALDETPKLHRSRLDTSFCTRWSGSSQLASDETLSRTACPGTELHCQPTRSADQLREMCSSPILRSQAHCPATNVIGISAGGFKNESHF